MTLGSDPLGRFSRDMAAAGRDLEDLSRPAAEAAALYADALRQEIPVDTGYAQSTIGADTEGAYVGAYYAGFIRDPYVDRAVDLVDPADPFEEYVDEVLDAHLSPIYV